MAKKLTKQYFLNKSKLLHGDKYNYDLVIINSAKDKVKIICPIHGDFEQIAYLHYTYNGCKKCSYSLIGQKLKLTASEFINKANKVHNYEYDYSKINYIDTNKNIEITCKKGHNFFQSPSNHLSGKGCLICSHSKKGKKKDTEEIIKKAITIHGERYDYSLVNYVNSIKKIKIICKEHGIFEQTASNHFKGKGCPICSKIISTVGYSKIKFENSDSIVCYLYLIKITTSQESFFKIGISGNPKRRHSEEYYKNNHVVLFNLKTNLKDAIFLENKILKFMKPYKYKPIIKFGGHTECFNPIDKSDGEVIDEIVELLKTYKLYIPRT